MNVGVRPPESLQKEFNQLIGETDHCLSSLLIWSERDTHPGRIRTLQHHAEDLIGAGSKIIENLNKRVRPVDHG